eukprot:m51a1_g11118 hypothetical protein (170) ;mRNA; r:108307-108987
MKRAPAASAAPKEGERAAKKQRRGAGGGTGGSKPPGRSHRSAEPDAKASDSATESEPQSVYPFTHCLAESRVVQGAALVEVLRPVQDVPWQRWTQQQRKDLERALAGAACVDGTGESRAGAAMFLSVSEQWSQFLAANPDVWQRVDPTYVFVDASRGQEPPPALLCHQG